MGAMNAPVDMKAMEGMFRPSYKQVEIRFDAGQGIAWTYMKPAGVPCFNPEMLSELRAHDTAIESCGGRLLHKGELHQIYYYVVASGIKDVFNLGGDLALFMSLINSRDRDALMNYAKLCVDNMHPRICNYHRPMIT